MTTTPTKRVELVYFDGCPNVSAARRGLEEALGRAGLPADWTEWDQEADDTPPAYRAYPSPTVLVGGTDVQGAHRSGGMACRAGGAPTADQILTALEAG